MVLKRYNTCFLLQEGENTLLVDAGGGSEILRRLAEAKVSLQEIGGMYITHSHTDHILGAVWVVRAVATEINENGYEGTFTICACQETLSNLRQICQMLLGKKMTKWFDKQIIFREVADGEELKLAGFDLTCFDICSTKMKQFGFLLSLPNGEKVCFSGDEPLKPECEHYAQGVKWLFAEAFCLYQDREQYKPYQRSHVTSLDAANTAQRLGVKNLVLYHTVDYGDDRRERMTAEVKGVYEGAVFVPEDMETVEL
jgi:ribonuclease Z